MKAPRWTRITDHLPHRRPYITIAAAVGYLLATIVMTWPLTPRAGSSVQDLGDPLFQIWIMRAVQHQLVSDPLHLYDANAFYPFERSLAYSEEAISTALVAWPVYLVTGNDVFTYNLMVLGTFWLLGFSIYLLAKELGASPGAAFVAGLIAAFFTGRHAHLSHLNLLAICWLPLALWGFTRFHRTRQTRYAFLGGIALAAQLLASMHLAALATLALAIYLPLMLIFDRERGPLDRAVIARTAAIVFVPYLVLLPTLFPHIEVGKQYGFERSRDEVERYSRVPDDYRSVSVRSRYLAGRLPSRPEGLFPGFIALAGVGLLGLRWRWQWNWSVGFATALTVIAVVMSFGLSMELFGRTIPMPYALVYDLVPPVRAIRAVGRFGLLTGIGIPLLSAFGMTAGWRWLRERLGHSRAAVGTLLTVALAFLAGLELRPEVGIAEVPSDSARVAVYGWLADQPDGPVVEFPATGLLDGPLEPIEYLYWSTRHWKPVLAGYSSFIPEAHLAILWRLDETGTHPSMVTPANVGVLQDLGIRYVIFHQRPGYDWRMAVEAAEALPELAFVTQAGDSAVYELHPDERPPVDLSLGPFPSTLPAGAAIAIPIELDNRNPNAAIVRLESDQRWTVDVFWEGSDGEVISQGRAPLRLPVIADAGSSLVALNAATPDEPGIYRLRLVLPEPFPKEIESQVEISAAIDRSEDVDLILERVVWIPDELRPGAEIDIQVSWLVLASPPSDYSGTVQLIDSTGEMQGQIDIELRSSAGPSSAWKSGDRVMTTFTLRIPEDVAPGEYRLLVAAYDAQQLDLPRVPVLLPDNRVVTEIVIDGVPVSP